MLPFAWLVSCHVRLQRCFGCATSSPSSFVSRNHVHVFAHLRSFVRSFVCGEISWFRFHPFPFRWEVVFLSFQPIQGLGNFDRSHLIFEWKEWRSHPFPFPFPFHRIGTERPSIHAVFDRRRTVVDRSIRSTRPGRGKTIACAKVADETKKKEGWNVGIEIDAMHVKIGAPKGSMGPDQHPTKRGLLDGRGRTHPCRHRTDQTRLEPKQERHGSPCWTCDPPSPPTTDTNQGNERQGEGIHPCLYPLPVSLSASDTFPGIVCV